jgi:SNF2 family DNA or RNA helicase
MDKQLKPLWDEFKYFAHQPPAIEWMLKQEDEGQTIRGVKVFGGVLGDEMGLGKTIEVAGLIKNSNLQKTLVLGPLAVVGTWASILQKSGFTVWTIRKGMWLPEGPVTAGKQCYITNLDKVLTNSLLIAEHDYDRVIIDEAHRIRNPGSRLAAACYKLKATCRWALTATPVVNSMVDVLSLYAFLKVPVLRPLKWKPAFHAWTAKLVFHRSLAELRNKLVDAPPEPIVNKMIVPFLTREEEEFYYGIQGTIADKLTAYSHDIKSNAAIFKLLLRLRQISVHPQVYIDAMKEEYKYTREKYSRDDWTGPATKFEAVARLLQTPNPEGKKTIIICHFNAEIALLKTFIESRALAQKVFTYDGSMSIVDRDATVAAAQEAGDGAVILVQLQAGGVGINLQTFTEVIFMTPWWNAALVDQAVGRAVRMGQRATVRVHHIMFEAEEEAQAGIVIDHFMTSKVEMKRQLLLDFWMGGPQAIEPAKVFKPSEEAVDEDPITV